MTDRHDYATDADLVVRDLFTGRMDVHFQSFTLHYDELVQALCEAMWRTANIQPSETIPAAGAERVRYLHEQAENLRTQMNEADEAFTDACVKQVDAQVAFEAARDEFMSTILDEGAQQ